MKRFAPTLFFAVVCFFGGAILVHDVAYSPISEATAVGGGSSGTASIATIGAGSSAQLFSALTDEIGVGSVVGSSGATLTNATLVTPNIGTATGTQLTLTQGISAVTGVFSGGLAITGSGSNNGVDSTGGSGGAIGVRGVGTGIFSGGQFEAAANGGGAIRLVPDTTSPQYPIIRVSGCADANPSASETLGGLGCITGGIWRTNTAATVWQSLSNNGLKGTVAAAGSTQADATAITAGNDFYQATGADATKGVTLTQGGAGTCFRIMNQSASVLKVYGHNSDNDTINGGAADAVYSHAAGVSLVYCTADGTAWLTY